MMPEPREDDDIALDKDTECEDCVCNEPDTMYANQYED